MFYFLFAGHLAAGSSRDRKLTSPEWGVMWARLEYGIAYWTQPSTTAIAGSTGWAILVAS